MIHKFFHLIPIMMNLRDLALDYCNTSILYRKSMMRLCPVCVAKPKFRVHEPPGPEHDNYVVNDSCIVVVLMQWASLCNAFLVEAKWFASEELPNPEEYLKNGTISSGVHVLGVHLFFLLGFGTTEKSVVKLEHVSAIISSVAKILRLWDDLGSAKVIISS